MTEELPEPAFHVLVTQLATQALIQLGAVPNPLTGQVEPSLPRARFTVGLLEILEDRTRGNLPDDEAALLRETLERLRARLAGS